MTIFLKIYPRLINWLAKVQYRLKFFSLSFLCVIVEGMDFWLKLGIRPFLFLTLLYISGIYSFPFLNVLSLLVLGLLQDGYYDYPLGYSSSQLLFLYLILIRQKKNQMLSSFVISWVYFSIFITIACILKVFAWEYIGRFPSSFKNVFGDVLLTISLFPLITRGVFWLTPKLHLSPVKEAG
jgi:cell shape-determining protein MreD